MDGLPGVLADWTDYDATGFELGKLSAGGDRNACRQSNATTRRTPSPPKRPARALITAKTCGQWVSGPKTAPAVSGSYAQTKSPVVHSTRSVVLCKSAGGTPTTDRSSEGQGRQTNWRCDVDGNDALCHVTRPTNSSGVVEGSRESSSAQVTQLALSISPEATQDPTPTASAYGSTGQPEGRGPVRVAESQRNCALRREGRRPCSRSRRTAAIDPWRPPTGRLRRSRCRNEDGETRCRRRCPYS
jgi:hypothetical protein